MMDPKERTQPFRTSVYCKVVLKNLISCKRFFTIWALNRVSIPNTPPQKK
jgi:hypothetical protein